MDGVRKTNVERRSVPGASFGTGSAPLKQYGEHDPGVKKAWDRQRTKSSIDEDFAEAQYGQSSIRKARVWREEKERELYQRTKDNQAGQMTRNAFARGARNTRNAGRFVGKKLGSEAIGAKVGSYAAARLKVTAANGWITGWTTFWYVTVQLPFALMSSVGIGVAAMVLSYISYIEESSRAGWFVVQAIGALAGLVTDTFSSVSGALEEITFFFTGIRVNPVALFAIPFIFLLGLGILQLMIGWFVYSLLGIRSLSGSFATAKVGLFILAAFSVVTPILNLFPVIMVWTILVWFKPR